MFGLCAALFALGATWYVSATKLRRSPPDRGPSWRYKPHLCRWLSHGGHPISRRLNAFQQRLGYRRRSLQKVESFAYPASFLRARGASFVTSQSSLDCARRDPQRLIHEHCMFARVARAQVAAVHVDGTPSPVSPGQSVSSQSQSAGSITRAPADLAMSISLAFTGAHALNCARVKPQRSNRRVPHKVRARRRQAICPGRWGC